MQEFDPRHPPVRYAPRLLVCAAGVAALVLGWHLTEREAEPAAAVRVLDPAAVAALQNEAFAQAEAQPGFGRPEKVAMKVARGETFRDAVMRLGVSSGEADQAVRALAGAFDTVNIKAGLAFEAAVARPRDRRGPVRLIGLSMRTGPASAITLSRTFDGALRLREMEERIREELYVAQGDMSGSLYASALEAGATPTLVNQATKLFTHKLDFSRDIKAGDQFRLVFDRKVTESGRTIDTGELRYAEIGAKGKVTRFYRYRPAGSTEAQYFDETGKNIRGFLLRTPLDGARITSRFGLRLHPILGYTRMHTGIDFGASTGTPVLAASDGVVEEARWNGGYGKWLRLKHGGGFSTGYAHLSRWAVKAGQRVRQGQVIAYVGSTGRSTGAHLHYEVFLKGQRINPKGAKIPQGVILEGRDLVAFKAEKAQIDRLIESGEPQALAAVDRAGDQPTAMQIALRAGEDSTGGGGPLRAALR